MTSNMAGNPDVTYRKVLSEIGTNLEKGDVKSAKFIIDENKKLFPAGELETVNTGIELMALLEKKGFVSETNVTDLDYLLEQITCTSLRSKLEPLKNKLTLCKAAKWKVGYARVPHFRKVTGCTRLTEILNANNTVALVGPPATGKTQLACNYAQEFFARNEDSVIWKLDCEGKTELIKSLLDLLDRLNMKPEGEMGGKTHHMEEMSQMVLDNLGGPIQAGNTHLLIFDDIGDSCNEIVSRILKNFKENSSNVKIIATMNGDIDAECETMRVTGLHDNEVVSFFRHNTDSDGAVSKATDDEIRELAKHFGNSPFGLMLSKHYIQKSGMDISDFTKTLKKDEKFIDNTEEHATNIVQYYKKRLLAAHKIILERVELKLNDDGKILLSLIPFLHHEHIPVKVLSKLLQSGSIERHEYEDSNVIERLRKYVLCDLQGLGNDRVISIHALTQLALLNRLSTDERNDRISELLQFFATNMTMDCRLRESMDTNTLFIDHAMNVLRMAREISNPPIKIRVLQCYVSTLIGVTFRIGGVDNFLVNAYLSQAMELCFAMIGDDVSNFEFKPSSMFEDHPKMDSEKHAKCITLVEKLTSLKANIPVDFIRDLLTSMIRPDKDMEHLQKRAKGLSRFSFKQQLEPDLYTELVKQKIAVPFDNVRDFFFVELLIVILYNNGRNHYLQKSRRRQFMELSWMLGTHLKEKCQMFLPVQYLITQRNGLLFMLLKLDPPTNLSDEQKVEALDNAVNKYTAMLQDKEDYFEFGILKVSKASKNFHHIAMCRKFLIKCYCRLFELHTSTETRKMVYDSGLECVQKLTDLITEMTAWTAVPGLYVQIAKFYLLVPPEIGNYVDEAINNFQTADSIEESTGVGLSHFRLQASFGLIKCYLKKRDKNSLKSATEKCTFLISNLHSSNSQESLKKAKEHQEKINEICSEEGIKL